MYKTLSKSRIIKTLKMDRRKLQRRLRILILLQQMRKIKQPNWKKKKRCWVRDILKNRERQGAFKTLFHEMRNDRELFFRYFRMSPERFDYLLTLVREQIEKKDTAFRKSFPGAGRLAITLRYLASGEMQQSLSCSYCIGRSTDYCFTLLDFGSYGSNNGCGVLSNLLMGEGIETNTFNIPEDEPLDGCKFTSLPYFLLGDDIFPLKKWLSHIQVETSVRNKIFTIITSLVLKVSYEIPLAF